MTATHLSSNQQQPGIFIQAENQPVQIIIMNCDISAKSGQFGPLVFGEDDTCYEKSQKANSGTFISASAYSSIVSYNNTFKQNDYSKGSGVFNLYGMQTMKSSMETCTWYGSVMHFYQQYGEISIDGLYMQGMRTVNTNQAIITTYLYDFFNVTMRNIYSTHQQSETMNNGLIQGYNYDTLILENIYIEYKNSSSFNEIYATDG
eukprot:403374895